MALILDPRVLHFQRAKAAKKKAAMQKKGAEILAAAHEKKKQTLAAEILHQNPTIDPALLGRIVNHRMR